MERSWLGNYGICGWKIDGQKRVADVFAKKTLQASKHRSHSKIREFPHCQR